jgi:hypothetical protein
MLLKLIILLYLVHGMNYGELPVALSPRKSAAMAKTILEQQRQREMRKVMKLLEDWGTEPKPQLTPEKIRRLIMPE